MKYLKSFNESNSYDGDFAITKIKQKFSENDVKNMLKLEQEMWSDDYSVNNNGEAEEIVIQNIINWFEKEFDNDLDQTQESRLSDLIIANYKTFK